MEFLKTYIGDPALKNLAEFMSTEKTTRPPYLTLLMKSVVMSQFAIHVRKFLVADVLKINLIAEIGIYLKNQSLLAFLILMFLESAWLVASNLPNIRYGTVFLVPVIFLWEVLYYGMDLPYPIEIVTRTAFPSIVMTITPYAMPLHALHYTIKCGLVYYDSIPKSPEDVILYFALLLINVDLNLRPRIIRPQVMVWMVSAISFVIWAHIKKFKA